MQTATLGTLDLTANGYGITAFDATEPGRVRLRLDVEGSDTDNLIDLIRGVQTEVNRATQAATPVSGIAWVTLTMQATASSAPVEYLVTGGTVFPPVLVGQDSGIEFMEGWLARLDVELTCLAETLGAEISYGPFTVTGADPTLHIDGIPGDHPAVAEVRIVDQSTNSAVVNRLRWACRSLFAMNDGDFDPLLALGGAEAEADTFTGVYKGITGGANWQAIGSVTGSAGQYVSGLYDIWLRARDATAALGQPTDLEATAVEGISRVQRQITIKDTVANVLSFDWPAATVEGNLLVLALGTTVDRTATTPTGWTAGPVAGTDPKLLTFYYPNAPSQSGTMTVTLSGTANSVRIFLLEYRGIATASPLDVSSTAATANSATASTGTTGTMNQNHGLGLAFWRLNENETADIDTSGWSDIANTSGAGLAQRVITAGGTHAVTASVDSGTPDWAAALLVFKGAQSVAPTLPAGSYSVQVVSLDSSGGLSQASESASVTLSAVGAIFYEWTSGGGPIADHRVYWKRDTDDNEYLATGSTDPNYQLNAETGSTVADPPGATTVSPAAFRLKIGPESGETVDRVTEPIYAEIANSIWEPLYAGRYYLPPSPMPLSATSPGFMLTVEGTSATNAQLDVDAIVLLPADEQQMDAQYTAGDLATLREWVVGTTADMRSYGFLRSIADSSEQGRVKALGYALLGPGDLTMVLLSTIANGVWNVEDISLSVTVIVRPRYRWLAGGL